MQLIQNTKGVLTTLLLLLIFAACEYDPQIAHPADYVNVYMPQALDNPDVYNQARLDTSQGVIFGAYYGGPDYPDRDIKVTFSVDTSLTEVYNIKNNTHYIPAPQGSYEISKLSAVIPKGKLSTEPLYITINKEKLIDSKSQYMIPLEIVSVDGANISPDLSITYFLIKME